MVGTLYNSTANRMAGIPLRRFLHWGPISALVIIKLIIWSMVHILPMYWDPYGSMAGCIHAACFMVFAGATLYYFLQSLLEGPGYLPLGWKPESEEDTIYLQYCNVCNGYKAPRSHHCRKCGRCVLKMDHHCPWINSCVGHANHAYFNMFLLCAVFGCFQASIVLSVSMYHAINRVWYVHHGVTDRPMIHLTLSTLLLLLLAIGMALGVVLAVGALFYMQIKGILRNRTSIEDWILEKATSRREEARLPPFLYPYDKGWRENLDSVFNTSSDGIEWPLREGCGKYDLTREQIAQKSDKRARSRQLICVSAYSGRWVPLLSRPRAALAAPCSDEPRLPLQPGDRVRATRQRTHWLFGEKLLPRAGGGEVRGPRGWFPRDAVVPSDELTRKSE